MKKRLLAVSLSANLLLLALCGWLWFLWSAPASTFPMAVPDCTPDFAYAGQLRLPADAIF